MKQLFFSALLSLSFLALPTYAHQVISISDGDTLTLLVDRTPLKIRLSDIDAPEKRQAFGTASRQSLSELCFGKDATYQVRNIDRYGRTVARVTCAGVDVNRAQVERGMAWVYTQYNADSSLPAAQEAAKAARIGLWVDKAPVPPWQFRRPGKGKSKDNGECKTGPRGGRYRIIDGRKLYGCF